MFFLHLFPSLLPFLPHSPLSAFPLSGARMFPSLASFLPQNPTNVSPLLLGSTSPQLCQSEHPSRRYCHSKSLLLPSRSSLTLCVCACVCECGKVCARACVCVCTVARLCVCVCHALVRACAHVCVPSYVGQVCGASYDGVGVNDCIVSGLSLYRFQCTHVCTYGI